MKINKALLGFALIGLLPAPAEVSHPATVKGSITCKGRSTKVLDAVALVGKNPDLYMLFLFDRKLKPAEVSALADSPTPELQKPRSVAYLAVDMKGRNRVPRVALIATPYTFLAEDDATSGVQLLAGSPPRIRVDYRRSRPESQGVEPFSVDFSAVCPAIVTKANAIFSDL